MFKVCIDSPLEGYVAKDSDFSIVGWAFCDGEIKKHSIYINGLLVSSYLIKIRRKDVYENYPNYPGALDSGFSIKIDISDLKFGLNEILIEVHNDSGDLISINRVIRKEKTGLEYHNYYIELKKEEERKRKKSFIRKINKNILVYVRFINLSLLSETLRSLEQQTYKNLNVKILTSEKHFEIKEILKEFTFYELEIVSVIEDISDIDYISIVDSGEIFDRLALENWAYFLSSEEPDLSYSDSDLYNDNGVHVYPNFKPDWSYEYFLSKDYIGGLYMVKNNPLFLTILNDSIFPFSSSYRYDIFLKLSEKTSCIQHVKQVLWSSPFLKDKSKIYDSEYDAVVSHILKNSEEDHVEKQGSIRRIKRNLCITPKVSIIIPTTGRVDLLIPCIESIIEKTIYSNYELIFLDNGRGKYPEGIEYLKNKNLKVIERNEGFNWSLLNNVGVEASNGELLLFMNDDIEIIHGNWLEELVTQAVRPDIGCVGGLLLYPDGNIQHAGVFLVDHGGGARHWLHFMNPKKDIYQDLHKVVREVSANTGACLMISRDLFEAVGGFDENLPVVGNDIDFCLRILERGYKNIWTPYSCMIHHESVSRKDVVYTDDEEKMWDKWGGTYLKGDAFYNPHLTMLDSDCSYNLEKIMSSYKQKNDSSKNCSFGVNLIGYIKAEMGVGEGARGVARALESANIPFCIINYEVSNPSRMGDSTWSHKIVDEPLYNINILHINADLTPQVVESLPEKYFKDKYTIGFWAWELPDFPAKWTSSFDCVDEVWCPSTFVKNSLVEKTSIPVYVFPHPIVKFEVPYLKRCYFGLPSEKFIFLSTYDSHSIQERKNPLGAIEAFKKAFKKNDPSVALVIKINNANEEEFKSLEKIVNNRNNVYFIRSEMSRYEMDSLIYQCDCFVSLHRSEGFGLILAESMALGTPVLATNWSGNVDFMNTSNSLPVEYTLKSLGQSFGPYEAYQYWANPSIDNAAQLMNMLLSSPKRTKEIISNGLHTSKTVLSPRSVGSAMKSRLNEISRKV